MEIIYTIAALVVLLVLAYLNKEDKEVFIFSSVFLILGSFLISYFLVGLNLYLALFLFGLALDRICITGRGDCPMEKDWVERIIFALIIIITVNISPKNIHLFYSFVSFFAGILVSWGLREIESIRRFIEGI